MRAGPRNWMLLTGACVSMFAMVVQAPAQDPDDGDIVPVELPNDPNYWRDAGFVEMVGPMRLPTDLDMGIHIGVWVRIPDDGRIKVRWLPEQERYTLEFPPGSVADRVETATNQQKAMITINGIEDVRGARIDAQGRSWFHDYQPVPGGPTDLIKGYEWLRAGPSADDAAADKLIALFFPGAPDDAAHAMSQFRRLNQCGACHARNRPAPKSAKARFITDADGFFQPITVMSNTMPVRSHRRWDLNADDPFITVRCGKDQVDASIDGGRRWYECADGGMPLGTLDLKAALKADDRHAQNVCAARTYLYDHMDAEGRKVFASAAAECSPG